MVLEIHEITPEIQQHLVFHREWFNEVSEFTFDDGLYSQFLNRELFYLHEKPMTFFISSSIICPERYEQTTGLSCAEYHKIAFDTTIQHKYPNHRFSGYMKLSQILQLQAEDCEIGSHNHEHKHYTNFEDFKNNLDYSLEFFKSKGIEIYRYCAPYNQRFVLGDAYVKSKGLKNVMNRTRIEDFIKSKELK